MKDNGWLRNKGWQCHRGTALKQSKPTAPLRNVDVWFVSSALDNPLCGDCPRHTTKGGGGARQDSTAYAPSDNFQS